MHYEDFSFQILVYLLVLAGLSKRSTNTAGKEYKHLGYNDNDIDDDNDDDVF